MAGSRSHWASSSAIRRFSWIRRRSRHRAAAAAAVAGSVDATAGCSGACRGRDWVVGWSWRSVIGVPFVNTGLHGRLAAVRTGTLPVIPGLQEDPPLPVPICSRRTMVNSRRSLEATGGAGPSAHKAQGPASPGTG